jgi:hypothetical protein
MKKDNDIKLDKDGNLQPMNVEESMNYIREELLKSTDSIVGKRVGEVDKGMIGNLVNETISLMPQVESSDTVSAKMRWESMGWKGRLEWRLMKTFFPNKVRTVQKIIENHNSLVYSYLDLFDKNPELEGYSEYGLNIIDYPNWCHPNPKTVVDVVSNIKLHSPVEFIKMGLEIGKK